MNPYRDALNASIVAQRMASYNLRKGAPRIGDFVRLPDGRAKRVAHVWEDGRIQLCVSGSFYLGKTIDGEACVDMSGGLDYPVSGDRIVPTEETMDGSIWIFDRDHPGAHRDVTFLVPFRVYELREG